uniref:Aurora kinase, other n=1 Tax=Tetraselmis sp. GSL018 TaxID=582737 RepID=A0A061R0S5_9CHLO
MDRGYEGAEALTTSIARSHLPVSKRAAPYTKFPTGASVGGGVRRTVATSTACPKAMQREKPWAVEDYTLLREIGKGSASVVHHAICKKSHCPVALKIYKKAQLTDVTRCQVERETRIHVGLQHRNILQCYGVFEDADAIYMVLEFAAGGDLMKVLTDNQRLTERQTIDVLRDLLAALEYLHGRAVIHRDIKPENILFTRQGILKLADFGSAIDVQKERPVSRLGTLDYMAPEVIRCPDKRSPDDGGGGGGARHGLQYCAKVDIWAVGILTFELLTGSPPFEQDTMEATVQSILSMQEQFPTFVSEPARRFVRHVLHKEPEVRPTVAQILLDRFLTDPPGSQPQDDRSLGELVLPQKISRIQSCSGLSGKASGDPSNMYRIPSSPYPHRMAVMRPPPEGVAPRSPDEAPPRYSPPSAAMPVPLPSAWSAPQQPHPQPAPAAMGWRPPYGAPRPPQPWYAQPSAAAQSGGRAREQASAAPGRGG